ncbi:MAG: ATPase domain-containing protein [Chloroflexota bacterium]
MHFVNLSDTACRLGTKRTLDAINQNVTSRNPSLIVIDSFRTLLLTGGSPGYQLNQELQSFLHDLSIELASWQVTSLLVGEYGQEELTTNPAFTIADGIIWLFQDAHRNAVVRKLQVVKMRTSRHSRELREYIITGNGLEVGGPFSDYNAVLSGIPTLSAPLTLMGLRLSDEERHVMQVLLQRGESTPQQVVQASGMDEATVRGILHGLSRRRYVAEVVEPGQRTYHAVLPELNMEGRSRRPFPPTGGSQPGRR